MPLSPEYQALLDELAEVPGPAINEMPAADAREMYRMMRPANPDIAVGEVSDDAIPGPGGEIPVRIYKPEGAGPHGILVNYHGGGWVIGDLDTADAVSRNLCTAANCIVVSVDYRLAPEHVYPAAVEDAFAALQWVADQTDKLGGNGRLAVGGESAGANLAAVVCLKARDQGRPGVNLQLLAYPVVDCDLTRQSYQDNGEGYLLTTDGMAWFWDNYCPDADLRRQPDASPIHADNHADLPPALVLTAEFDPLRDEGEQYADVLKSAGTDVEAIRFDGLIHDFLATAGMFEASSAAFEQVATRVKNALS